MPTARWGVVSAEREKNLVALSSVLAAVFLTGFKLVVGLRTNSLGILSEAAHSGLDLVAAAMTYLAVRVSDRPADADHPFGHGKYENLSAFVETLLLLLTCIWIVYESVERLVGANQHVDATPWAFAVMAVSVVIDISRSRALAAAARRYGSQALEADALHFSTDVWSSAVVILGLCAVRLGDVFVAQRAWLQRADAIAALMVAAIVVHVSLRLGRRTVDMLVDRAPAGVQEQLVAGIAKVEGVLAVRRLRVRGSGARTFVDVEVEASRSATFEATHEMAAAVEERIRQVLPTSDVVVHTEPMQLSDEPLAARVTGAAARCHLAVHNIAAHRHEGGVALDIHVEVDDGLSLGAAHQAATRLEDELRKQIPEVRVVTTHIEPRPTPVPAGRSLDGAEASEVADRVRRLAAELPGIRDTHEVQASRVGDRLHVSLHLAFDRDVAVVDAHAAADLLEDRIRHALPAVARVTIHAEPCAASATEAAPLAAGEQASAPPAEEAGARPARQ